MMDVPGIYALRRRRPGKRWSCSFTWPSLLAASLSDDVCRQLRAVAGADVLRGVDRAHRVNRTPPAFSVTGGLPSSAYSSAPSMT